jgi:uncharacterized membrane protein YcaP (DUF421 family)
MWDNLFHLNLWWGEKIIRAAAVYLFLIVGFRLAGKRELSQLNSFDFVMIITISNTVQNAIIGNDNTLLGGLIGGSTMLVLNYLMVRWVFYTPAVEKALEGEATLLVSGGQLLHTALEKELITPQELLLAAQKQGIASLDEVESASLQPGGSFWFQRKTDGVDVATQLQQLQAQLARMEAQLASLKE